MTPTAPSEDEIKAGDRVFHIDGALTVVAVDAGVAWVRRDEHERGELIATSILCRIGTMR